MTSLPAWTRNARAGYVIAYEETALVPTTPKTISDKRSVTVRCDHCGTPVFEVRNGRILLLKAKHHGQDHVSTFELEALATMGAPEDGGPC